MIELMIVVAIIGILAAVAVPSFISYRNKSKVSAMLSTSSMIRASMASYAADDINAAYPATAAIPSGNPAPLQTLLQWHGSTLIANKFSVVSYARLDNDLDGTEESYALRVAVNDVPISVGGFELLITPTAIFKCTAIGTPC